MSAQIERFEYDNKIVKQFAYATALWGIVGMAAGLLAALQLVWPALNFELPQTSFGRVRPIHTNAVIFAFVGNGIRRVCGVICSVKFTFGVGSSLS
jgi:cytochrome c oxidase cbb3-type subunit I/II